LHCGSRRRRAAVVGELLEWLVLLFVLGACSGGHEGKNGTSSPGGSPERAIATSNGRDISFPKCAKSFPSAPHPTADADPAALTRALVPIAAAAVRVCRYAADHLLIAEGVVRTPEVVARVLAATSRLPTRAPSASTCPGNIESQFFVTFSNGSTDIDVVDADECGFVTNGKAVAFGARSWRLVLADAGLTIVADHQIPIPTTPGAHESHGKFLTGTLAADGACFWVEAADHTRTDVVWPSGYTARLEPRRVIDFGFHVLGVVGQDIVLGGERARMSSSLLNAVAPGVRHCLPPPDCRGDACSLWIAA
jgi:hypothetical protein